MESFARLLVWLMVVLAALQLVMGGWGRLRAWLAAKFIGVAPPHAAAAGAR